MTNYQILDTKTNRMGEPWRNLPRSSYA